MRYCDSCATKNNYPRSIAGIVTACQMCGNVETCNDVPAERVPRPTKPPTEAERARLTAIIARLTQPGRRVITLTDHEARDLAAEFRRLRAFEPR